MYNQDKQEPYVGAPYNFVSFSNDVYEYQPGQLANQGELSDERFTGEIDYELTAKTPIMVDDGTGHFHKNEYGQYSIPGSTMRGLIRNHVQILGLSSMADDIDDYALMYRNVANGKEKDRYTAVLDAKTVSDDGKNISVLLNVKAGYLAKENGKYVIYQTEKDFIKPAYKEMNYYVLSERKIISNYLSAKKSRGTFDYSFFMQDGKCILQHNLNKPFEKYTDRNGKLHYKGDESKWYEPYAKEVSYELAGVKDVIAVGKPGMYSKEGYVVSTGPMKEKKAVYIIPKIDYTKEAIEIPEADVRAFRIDYEKKKNTLKRFGDAYFRLPEKGIKPVFYIFLDGRLYFGFTPRLRLFYDFTIKDGLNKKHKEGMLDYAKVLFGYSNKNSGYKSRVSFADAVLVGQETEQQEVQLILAEPKPTSYCDYLMPKDGKAVTYNTKGENSNEAGFKLRGVKQYWLHKKVVTPEVKKFNVASTMHPLPEGSVFRGKVRFKNLTADELGLLLWSIRLRDDSWVNVGKAKAYGYGNAELKLKAVKRVNTKLAYCNGNALCLNPMEPVSGEELIQCYKDTINERLKGKTIEQLPHIKEFFFMKDASAMPDEKKIRYMDLNMDYRYRKDKVLQRVNELVTKK